MRPRAGKANRSAPPTALEQLTGEQINTFATFPPKFEPFMSESARWKIVYGGRAGGKTESIAKALLIKGQQQPLRILCARETMSSIKQSVYSVLQAQIGVLGMSNYYSIEQSIIYGPWIKCRDFQTGAEMLRRTEFFFCGLRELTVDSIKSYYDIQICWMEEAQALSRRSLQVIEPTIRRAGGSDPSLPCELWMSFNPRYEHDAVMDLIRDPPPDSIIIEMNWRDNPWFEQTGLRPAMEKMKRRNFELYEHIWEGKCLKYWEGQIYLNELKLAEDEGRICDVPYRPDAPAEVVFDIGGAGDATALWVFQKIGDWVHLIDYHEKVQSSLDYFLKWLENKPYVLTMYWLPHDAKQKHAGMPMSYEGLVRAKGKKVRIVPASSVQEGINALRTLFGQIKIDKDKCAQGIEALRNYSFEVESDEKGGFKSKPIHSKYSHGSDAARYLAHAVRMAKEVKTPPGKYNNTRPFRDSGSAWASM